MYRDTEYSDELIQRAYDAAMERMGPIGRVEKMCKMYHEVWLMLAHQVSLEDPSISPREVQRRVALRMYMSDEQTQKLLQRITV